MKKYSKAIGTIVGALLSLLVSFGILPADIQTPEAISAITTIGGLIGTIFFPANEVAE